VVVLQAAGNGVTGFDADTIPVSRTSEQASQSSTVTDLPLPFQDCGSEVSSTGTGGISYCAIDPSAPPSEHSSLGSVTDCGSQTPLLAKHVGESLALDSMSAENESSLESGAEGLPNAQKRVDSVTVKKEGCCKKEERDSKKKWGLSIKRGCTARFTVKVLLHAPHVSEVCILQGKHVDQNGFLVHGGMKVGDRSAYSAHLSPIIKEFVDGCLQEGYNAHQIMKKHLKFLQKWQAEGKDITWDLLITRKDIRNISMKLASETYMLHPNDAQRVRMWVQKNPEKTFYYSETNLAVPVQVQGQLNGDNMPFTIGIQTPWQRQKMAKHGNGGAVSIDATFGTNDKKVRN